MIDQHSLEEEPAIWSGKDIKSAFRELFAGVNDEATGTFATANVLNDVPLPGLYVEGFGPVGLPLSEREARSLIAFTHQAPFGKGSDTIVDTDVRNTWEVNAAQIQLRNSSWSQFVDGLLEQVTSELGIVGGRRSVKADLYKLLLYEEGGFFEKHLDSEKAHGMFGTLVISLPSCHKGGDVQASFNNDTKTLRTAPSSEFQYSYLAWYSDVEHRIEKVTSGYRLVLTYNLIHTSNRSDMQTANSILQNHLPLRKIFQEWAASIERVVSEAPSYLVYLLDHKYTDANLQLAHLKGKDQFKAASLMNAIKDDSGLVFLANLQRTIEGGTDEDDGYSTPGRKVVTGGDHHDIGDVIDDMLELRHLMNLDGTQLAKEVTINECDIVQENALGNVPDEEDYSGYTGNEGCHVTHYYRRSAFIIIPKQAEATFLLKLAKEGEYDIIKWLRRTLDQDNVEPSAVSQHHTIRLCDTVLRGMASPAEESERYVYGWRDPRTKGFDSSFVLGQIVLIACELDSRYLFENAARQAQRLLDDSVYVAIGHKLQSASFELWRNGIELLLAPLNKLREKYSAIVCIRDSLKGNCKTEENETLLKEWAKTILTEHITKVDRYEPSDASSLANLGVDMGERYLFDVPLNTVKKHLSNLEFVIGFANAIAKLESEGKVRSEVAKNVFHDVLFNLTLQFSLLYNGEPSETEKRPRYMANQPLSRQPRGLDGQKLGTLMEYSFRFSISQPIVDILAKISEAIPGISIDILKQTVFPLLSALSESIAKRSMLQRSEDYETIPRQLLEKVYSQAAQKLFKESVGPRPQRPIDWVRDQVKCNCHDCVSLNEFLRDPTQQVGRFSMAKRRRGHLEAGLAMYSRCDCSTVRVGNPQTLVVTKTLEKYQKASTAFEKRLHEAIDHLSSIEYETLTGLMGYKMRAPLKDCVWVKEAIGDLTLLGTVSTNSNQTRLQPPLTTKRSSENGIQTIDLT